jgi:DNA-directed RNA polymerase specialized sigma24 family protein
MELEQFVEDILVEQGLNNEEPDVYAELKNDLLESVETRINAMVVANLSADDLIAFEAQLDSASPEENAAFVKAHVPDLDQKVAAELLDFKAAYLG